MNILIEVPTWLGDSVMATPAIENIVKFYPNAKLTIFGSMTGVAIFKHHPNVEKIIIDQSRSGGSRYFWLYNRAKNLKFDAVFSFRRQFSSKFFAYFVNTSKRYHYQRYDNNSIHQVLRYNEFINKSLKINAKAAKLKIHLNNKSTELKPMLGINSGASYGSAKRWYPQEFAKVASQLSNKYDVIIFGGKAEVDIAGDIEKILLENDIKNYKNLAGKTNIDELINKIAQLDLFITGDSGPMHLAAAFQIPTVAIFGPTKDEETSQWMNEKSVIVKKDFNCQPCMKRVCPLKGSAYHQCMKNIDARAVLNAVDGL